MGLIRKMYEKRWMFRSIIPTIWFNFHYLPFRQAVRLPILLYKPKLLACRGKVVVQADKIRTGMIQLGVPSVSVYPNSGITFENRGGIFFNGDCTIGNNSFVSVGETGKVVLGDKFCATSSLKLISYCGIEIGKDVLCGWECMFLDTDFHRLTQIDGGSLPAAYGKISIGDGCWLGAKSIILKNMVLPAYCVAALGSLLNKRYEIPEKSLVAGQPVALKKTGVYRNPCDDEVAYG